MAASPLQRLALDVPNELIAAFPLAMVHVLLVQLSILPHLASLKKLRQDETVKPSVRPAFAIEPN